MSNLQCEQSGLLKNSRSCKNTTHGNVGLPSGVVVKTALTGVLSLPFSTANTLSVYVTSGMRLDAVFKPGLLNVLAPGMGIPALWCVKVTL